MTSTKKRQQKEIIKCGKDPIYFFKKYVKIQHPTKGQISFDTFDFQDDCVQSFNDHRFNVILKSRQLGLSTLSAAYATWLTLFYKDKNVLIIATKLAVAQNFIRKVKVAIKNLPPFLILPEIISNNKQSIEFSNGSTIKAVPTSEDAGRSEALTLLIIDEAAFVRNFDTLWTGLYPTLSTGGRAIVLSTPNGVGGQYYDIWMKAIQGENEFNAIKLQWDVHPERDDAWFDQEIKNMSEKQVAQELMCDFAASGETFLQPRDIEWVRNNTRSPIEKWGPKQAVWVWKYPISGKNYVISADVSRGDSRDYSAFHVIDPEESTVVAEFKGKIPPDQFALLLAEAGRRYNNALLCPENNTYGYAVILKLKEEGYTNLYFKNLKDRYNSNFLDSSNISKIGFTASSKSRNQILTKLEEIIRNKHINIYSQRFYNELKTFVWKGNKAEAQRGSNDDLIMSLAIGVWIYDYKSTGKEKIDMNQAMLAGFNINSNNFNDSDINYDTSIYRSKSPYALNGDKIFPGAKWNWLLK